MSSQASESDFVISKGTFKRKPSAANATVALHIVLTSFNTSRSQDSIPLSTTVYEKLLSLRFWVRGICPGTPLSLLFSSLFSCECRGAPAPISAFLALLLLKDRRDQLVLLP